jgi:MFS family permease
MNKSKKSKQSLLILFILFFSWEFFLRISPSLVITQLATQYNTNAMGLGAIAGFYYLGYSLIQIPAGMIIDKYSLKKIGIISLAICLLTILFFIFNKSLTFALISRAIMGAASAFSFIGVLAIAKRYFPDKFNLITSITISLGTLLAAFSQVGASFFISEKTNNWHQPFVILSLTGLILITGMILIKKQNNNINNNNTQKTNNNLIKKCAKLIINPGILLNGIIGGLLYLPSSIISDTWGINFFEIKSNVTRSEGTIIIMCLFLGWAIGSLLIGIINKNTENQKNKTLIQLLGFLAIASIISIIYAPIHNYYILSVFTLLFGIGSSSQILVWCDFNNRNINPQDIGLAIAIVNMLTIGISSIGQIIMGAIIARANIYFNNTANISSISSLDAYYTAFAIIPVMIFIGIIIASYFFTNQDLNINKNINKNINSNIKINTNI